MNYIVVFVGLALITTWGYTSFKTGGLIDKRYANQDAQGRVKESKFTGREEVAQNEINTFTELAKRGFYQFVIFEKSVNSDGFGFGTSTDPLIL